MVHVTVPNKAEMSRLNFFNQSGELPHFTAPSTLMELSCTYNGVNGDKAGAFKLLTSSWLSRDTI